MTILSSSTNYNQPTLKKQNDLIDIITTSTIVCPSLSNTKQWTIYKINNYSDLNGQKIKINNNPTLNFAELVLQPQTLSHGLYKFVFTLTMINTGSGNLSSKAETFIQTIPSGLVLSSLKLSKPMFGGTIEITRGLNQAIEFDPFLFTYDIDSVAVITSLSFKYACQVIDSNLPTGYSKQSGTNQTVYLNQMKLNTSLQILNKCFNSTSNFFLNILSLL